MSLDGADTKPGVWMRGLSLEGADTRPEVWMRSVSLNRAETRRAAHLDVDTKTSSVGERFCVVGWSWHETRSVNERSLSLDGADRRPEVWVRGLCHWMELTGDQKCEWEVSAIGWSWQETRSVNERSLPLDGADRRPEVWMRGLCHWMELTGDQKCEWGLCHWMELTGDQKCEWEVSVIGWSWHKVDSVRWFSFVASDSSNIGQERPSSVCFLQVFLFGWVGRRGRGSSCFWRPSPVTKLI